MSASLGQQLGFTRTTFEEKSFNVGQFASEKLISEAVVIIPYFERPVTLVGVNTFNTDQYQAGIVNTFPANELFATREIIPGKHFLPIHKMLFDNLLTMKLVTDAHSPTELIPTEEGIKPDYVGFESEDSYNAARETDVYQMLETLVGNEKSNISGYELPPEFDFVNYNVDPFQMIVVPVDHVLRKQELIDIYQGIMPESSLKFTKTAAFAEIRPTRPLGADYSWMPKTHLVQAPGSKAAGNLETIFPQNFLSPAFLNNDELLSKVDKKKKGNLWLKDSQDFYKNLKFMTFKIKQKAFKDYDKYKNRQIQKVLDQSALTDVPADEQSKVVVEKLEGSLLKKTVGEVFGSNWPYDDFSLIEMVKIDIDLEVL